MAAEKKPKATHVKCVGGGSTELRIEAGLTPPPVVPFKSGDYVMEDGVYHWRSK